MAKPATLDEHLGAWAGLEPVRRAVATTVAALAGAAAELAAIVARGPLDGPLGKAAGAKADGDGDGDPPKVLDGLADRLLTAALRAAPVAALVSEAAAEPVILDPAAPLAVAIDPLDGSSNIDTNIPIGTFFGLWPVPQDRPAAAFAQPGRLQLAAGFVIYGPSTALVVTLGAGTHIFTLDPVRRTFWLTHEGVQIPQDRPEYAINASNYRHWDEPIRTYIDDCIAGRDGPQGRDFNMRWIASLVAEAFRILIRGGVFLDPRDGRPGHEQGRLRLLHEAAPLAFLVEQAGGQATDGRRAIADLVASGPHMRTPLVFGSHDKVQRVAAYHAREPSSAAVSPLFGRRGLFRG